MSRSDLQARINRIRWYHEFDFGNGLKTTSCSVEPQEHREGWRFIEQQLDQIDFQGKTVLEVGCWDGYWSFQAERRGARSVLATDDRTQNWSSGEGVHLAREVLQSRVEINQDVSIYRLGSLNRTFDIILCMGVYYHLYDPFHAFAQLRHCCHANSVVLVEGDIGRYLTATEARYEIGPADRRAFLPSEPLLEKMLGAAYLRIQSRAVRVPRAPWHKVLFNRVLQRKLDISNRIFLTCVPFTGVNPLHPYEPPFGLGAYDDRFGGRG